MIPLINSPSANSASPAFHRFAPLSAMLTFSQYRISPVVPTMINPGSRLLGSVAVGTKAAKERGEKMETAAGREVDGGRRKT